MQLKAAKLATWQFAHSKGLPRGLDAENLKYRQNWDLRWADARIECPIELIESGVRDFPPCVLGWTFWIG